MDEKVAVGAGGPLVPGGVFDLQSRQDGRQIQGVREPGSLPDQIRRIEVKGFLGGAFYLLAP